MVIGKSLRGTVLPVLVVLPLALLAGCSDSADPDLPTAGGKQSASASAQSGGSDEADKAMLAYVRCLRDEGIEVDDPVDGNLSIPLEGQDEKSVQEAQKACEKFQREMESGDGGDSAGQPEDEAVAAYRLKLNRCMREKGVDAPDDKPVELEEGDVEHEKAMRECYKEIGPPSQSTTAAP